MSWVQGSAEFEVYEEVLPGGRIVHIVAGNRLFIQCKEPNHASCLADSLNRAEKVEVTDYLPPPSQ